MKYSVSRWRTVHGPQEASGPGSLPLFTRIYRRSLLKSELSGAKCPTLFLEPVANPK